MKRLFYLLLFLPVIIYAQSATISGTVKDETGNLLPGVTIQIKNTESLGAVSDFDGNYMLSVPKNS